jgi:NADPH:quinone reductase-like Zn-dependent oxidoreductase
MKKAVYEKRGPIPEAVIEAVEFDKPALQSGQVLVEVLAAPINPSDLLTLTGEYGILPPLPAVGGNEGVGRVAAHGPDVDQPVVGQTVMLPPGSGTWATHLVAEAAGLVPLPDGADPLQLAMMTINPPTASLLLSTFVDLQPGDWVIQNAANSGVGGYLVQLAKIRGFRTVNVVRREDAVTGIREKGGDVALVDGDDLRKRVAEATGGASIQLGIDAVAGTATDRIAQCLGPGATLVNYGAMSREACTLPPQSFIFNDITLRGFWLARWFQNASPEDQMAVFGELTPLIAGGRLRADVHATYDVDQIQDAVAEAALEGRKGKVLVVPGGVSLA